LKKGDVLSPLTLNFAEGKQKDLEVNIIYQVLIYGDGVKTLDGSTYTIQKNTKDGSC
jgi:hypothetical protein